MFDSNTLPMIAPTARVTAKLLRCNARSAIIRCVWGEGGVLVLVLVLVLAVGGDVPLMSKPREAYFGSGSTPEETRTKPHATTAHGGISMRDVEWDTAGRMCRTTRTAYQPPR